MNTYLYEKDLRQMKLTILESRRHDAVVMELAATLGIKRQQLRKILIERSDMMFLENLPARCDAARETGDETERLLGIPLLTQAFHLLSKEEGSLVREQYLQRIQNGITLEVALSEAQMEILELIRS
jgi:energy-converting hydrogenase A subunit M